MLGMCVALWAVGRALRVHVAPRHTVARMSVPGDLRQLVHGLSFVVT